MIAAEADGNGQEEYDKTGRKGGLIEINIPFIVESQSSNRNNNLPWTLRGRNR